MKITNKLDLPQAIVNGLTSDYTYKEKQFSATSILQGLKSLILQKRHSNEIEMDASDGINLILGTAVHSIFSNQEQKEDELAEEYVIYELPNGYKLSGRFDLYSIERESIEDYKTCSVWKIKFKDYAEWKKQLLIYAWILKKLGFPCKKGTINYLIKDWSKSQLRLAKIKGEFYPESAIGKVEFEFTNEDLDYIENWILNRFDEIAAYEQLNDDSIPYCSDEERFHDQDKFAVIRKGNKRAIKLFDNLVDAESYRSNLNDNNIIVELRKGEDKKCLDYCNACEYCNYYKENVKEKED